MRKANLTRHLNMKLTEDMDQWIEQAAYYWGTSKAEVVRRAIREKQIKQKITLKEEDFPKEEHER